MFNGDTLFASSEAFLFLNVILPFIFTLLLIGFGIYFFIRVISYLNSKIKLDKERNEKIDELIQMIRKDKD